MTGKCLILWYLEMVQGLQCLPCKYKAVSSVPHASSCTPATQLSGLPATNHMVDLCEQASLEQESLIMQHCHQQREDEGEGNMMHK